MTDSRRFDESHLRETIRLVSQLHTCPHAVGGADGILHHLTQFTGGHAAAAVTGESITQGWQTCVTHTGGGDHTSRNYAKAIAVDAVAHAFDPTLEPLTTQFAQRDTLVLTRRDLVDDQTWYACDWYSKHLGSASLDDTVFVLASGHDGSGFRGYVLHRDRSSGAFDDHRVAVLALVAKHVDVLFTRGVGTFATKTAGLSPRLRETVDHLLGNRDRRGIANDMNVTESTVHDYIKKVFKHFNVHSRAELTAMARAGS